MKAATRLLVVALVVSLVLALGAMTVAAAGPVHMGGTDYPTIQAAIDAATGGETITVDAGTYNEILDVDKSVTINGAGEGVTVVDSTGLSGLNAAILVSASNVTITDLTLGCDIADSDPRYGLKAYNVSDLVVEDVTVTEAYRSGFDLLGVAGATLTRCSAVNNGGHGVAVTDSSDVVMTDITATGNAWSPISLNTWGEWAPVGLSGIVLQGTNTISGPYPCQLEQGTHPSGPPTLISISTNAADLADVTVQASDFAWALSGDDDEAPAYKRVLLFQTYADAQTAAAFGPQVGHIVGNRYVWDLVKPDQYYVTSPTYCSIQAAIDACPAGGTVNIEPGTYTENILVDKQVDIVGAGSGDDDTANTIITANTTVSGDTKVGVVQLAASGASAADPILFQDLRVAPVGMAGFSVGRFYETTGTSVADVKLDNVQVVGTNANPSTEQERGLYVDNTSSLSGLVVENCAFNNLTYGWYFQKAVSADASDVSDVTVANTSFNHNNHKGVYAEKLSDATFTDCEVNDNGYDSSILPSYFMAWSCGVDINLKAGAYSDLSFIDCTMDNNATDEAKEGAALMVKARDDGATYGAFPATLDNVLVQGGSYTNNERGIRTGEPGKNNATPTNVVIRGATLSGNTQHYAGGDGSSYGDLVNASTAPVDARGCYWGADAPAASQIAESPGAVDFTPWLMAAAPTTQYGTDDSIQEAIDFCAAGDTINVWPGTYAEDVQVTKSLTIQGYSGAYTVDTTGQPGSNNAAVYVSVGSVTIKDMVVDPNGAVSTPRYGLKVGEVDGVVLENVTVTDAYRTGFDLLGSSNVTMTGCSAIDNGGHGISVTDCTGVTMTDITATGNGWSPISFNTWGRYTTNHGLSGIVLQGSNTISGSPSQLEQGTYPAGPPMLISISTNPADGADVTVQASDFAWALSGDDDEDPAYKRVILFQSYADAAAAAELPAVGHIVDNYYVWDLVNPDQYYVTSDTKCSIQAALDACPDGGTVNVKAGTYVEALVVSKPVSLLGATAGVNKNGYTVPADYAWDDTVETIIEHPDPVGGYLAIVDIEDVDDVVFDGFVVQEKNAVANQNSSLVRVAAHTREISNVSVVNCVIGPNTNVTAQDGAQGRMGLYIVNWPYNDWCGVVDSTFSHNKIFDTQGNGDCVFLWSSYHAYGAAGGTSMHGTVLEDNEIYGSRRSGFESAGGYKDLVIRDNTIYDCASTVAGAPASDLLKYGNGVMLIRGASDKMGDAATAFGPENLTIEGNEIYGCEKNGIYMGPMNKDYVVADNIIRDNGWCGIMLDLEGRHWNGTYEPPPDPADKYAVYDGSSNVVASDNAFTGNGQCGVRVAGVPTNGFVLDATESWWGAASGPGPVGPGSGDAVSEYVDYSPWYGDAAMTWTASESASGAIEIPADMPRDQANAIIADAPYGATILLLASEPAGTCHDGGLLLTAAGLTVTAETGACVTFGSSAFTVSAPDITLQGITLNGTSSHEGILVTAGGDNLAILDCEFSGWNKAIEIDSNVTSFKMIGNYVHDGNVGLSVADVSLGGVVTVEGNLFKALTLGVESAANLDVTYNSWGMLGDPAAMIGGSGTVTYAPWTYAELFMDMIPDSEATLVEVNESETFMVELKVDAAEMTGLTFKLNYDTDYMTLQSKTFAAPFAGSETDLDASPVDGQENYRITLMSPASGDGMTVVELEFLADGGMGNGIWEQYFDISDVEAETSAGAPGGVKIFVNNAGYGLPSDGARDITDADDGKVLMNGIANYTGFADLQGRANDAGATVAISQSLTLKAGATSASSGAWTSAHESGELLVIGEVYDIIIDAPLYLPSAVNSVELTDRPLTDLALCKLLGGDANDDDEIGINDITLIGGNYGLPTGSASTPNADVNADGMVDILDLVLAAGNYDLDESPWTAI